MARRWPLVFPPPGNVRHPREKGEYMADPSEMLSKHRSRLLSTLERLVPEGPVALLGCPSHRNVGDQAIWLGQREAIWALDDRRPVYACSIASYDAAELRRRLGHGTILLTGGGNLGDLYPAEQAFREQVLKDFRNAGWSFYRNRCTSGGMSRWREPDAPSNRTPTLS